jgi:dihydrofolate synthase / folylpolyglutamate synthase
MNTDTKITSFKDVETVLRPFVPLVSQLTGKDTVLDRIIPLMHFLGDPHKNLKAIHIAGTSGKTSTAYYISRLLRASGKSVGLTVSPHIDKINERVQINGRPLEDEKFFKELETFLDLVKQSSVMPSYFELMSAFAIWVFSKYKVDYAVIETGLGGLYDSTNILDREDKVCVITDIGFDHMHILGDTIAKITAQKVGIVHDHNQLLMYQQDEIVMAVVEKWTQNHQAVLHTTTQENEMARYTPNPVFKELADYQKHNWLLAYYVYRFVSQTDNLKTLTDQQIESTQQLVVPARMDEIKMEDKLVIMDGAHNEQKMRAFISSFQHRYPNTKAGFLLAFKTDKEYQKVLPILKDVAGSIVLTTFDTSQDLPVKSVDPAEVASELDSLGVTDYKIEKDHNQALKLILDSDNKIIVVTGSFYLISQLREKAISHD